MDDLIAKITEKYNIPADKAKGIINTVAEYLGDKLPAPIAGQVTKLLGGGDDDGNGGDDDGNGGGLMDSAKGMLGL